MCANLSEMQVCVLEQGQTRQAKNSTREMIMINLSDEQRGFVPWFLDKSRTSRCLRLVGYAGTGKTTVMKELDKILPPERVVWCCPCHEAKNILNKKLDRGEAVTLAKALGLLPKTINGETVFLPKVNGEIVNKCRKHHDVVVVVDEASMVSRDNLRYLLASPAKNILFIGDDAQLPPVSEKVSPVYSHQHANWPTYTLEEIFRQPHGSNICLVAQDTRDKGVNTTEQHGIRNITLTEDNVEWFYRTYPHGIALCPTHHVKDFCNKVARKVIHGCTPENRFILDETLLLESPINPPEGPTNGDRVVISSHPKLAVIHPGIKVWSMEVVPLSGAGEYEINVPYDESERKRLKNHLKRLQMACRDKKIPEKQREEMNREAEILTNRITLAAHGFAMTIHSSQGSTFDEVLLCTTGIDPFRNEGIHINMIYTGITRAAKTLVVGISA